MIFLPDTNAVSGLMRGDTRLVEWMASVGKEDELVVCPIVVGELLFGLERLPDGRRKAELEASTRRLLEAFRCSPIPAKAAEHYAKVKVSQQRRGLSMDENDLWIAASAIAMGASLVSLDQDFGRLESGIRICP